MDVFSATEKIKDFVYENNNSLIKVGDDLELSSCQMSILFCFDEITTHEDYHKKTTFLGKSVGKHYNANEFIVSRRRINFNYFNIEHLLSNTPQKVNTKEYWNFLHKEFQFCDVMSYPTFPNLENYFGVKGPLYDGKIDLLPKKLKFFSKKKILEIGGGYGYLLKILKENKIPHKYYHADIVNRFDCDNFIDLDGYNLSPFISEKFDVIVMFDVLQHLSFDTIHSYFKDMVHLLTDDGHIIFESLTLNKDQQTIGTFFAQTYINPSQSELETLLHDNFNVTKIDYCFNGIKESDLYILTKKQKK